MWQLAMIQKMECLDVFFLYLYDAFPSADFVRTKLVDSLLQTSLYCQSGFQ